ncbi:MAG TPA: sugar ABC transporter permease, partial [Candidatus Acidoferrum sp.]|nr:sugar ABC transporter permease [Candidatus Acidoferrum sp.]
MKDRIGGGEGGDAIAHGLPQPPASRRVCLSRFLEGEGLLAFLLLTPTAVLLAAFVAYPFAMGIWLALSSTSVGSPGHFIGVRNFLKAWDDSIFRVALGNTFIYTFWATLCKLALGMWLALLINRHFRGQRMVRASMLLPFIVPTVLSTFAWRWMFDPTFSVLNWLLFRSNLISMKLPFLSDTGWALG